MSNLVPLSVGHQVWVWLVPRLRVIAGVATAFFVLLLSAPHSTEWDSNHLHIVVGGTPAEQARALAAHLAHNEESAHAETTLPTAREPAKPARLRGTTGRVLSIESGAAEESVSEISGAIIAATFQGSLPRPLAFGRLAFFVPLFLPELVLFLSDPPPRTS